MTSRLFLVDSSPAVQRLVEQAVANESFEVNAFRRAHSALDAANRYRPDIVVADYHLEDMAFAAFCERLTSKEDLSSVPIISLLGSSDRLEEKQLQMLGVKAVLKKPLQAEDLLKMIRLLRSQERDATPIAYAGNGVLSQVGQLAEREDAEDSQSVRFSELPVKPSVTWPISPEPTSPSSDTSGDAMPNVFSQLFQTLVEHAERSLATRLPELVTKEVHGCIEMTTAAERVDKTTQSMVDRVLPGLVGERVTALEPMIQETVKEITTSLVSELLNTQLRDMMVATLPDSVAVALKEHVTKIEDMAKELAQDAALRQARETADTIVREVSRDLVKGVFEQAMREMTTGLTPAR